MDADVGRTEHHPEGIDADWTTADIHIINRGMGPLRFHQVLDLSRVRLGKEVEVVEGPTGVDVAVVGAGEVEVFEVDIKEGPLDWESTSSKMGRSGNKGLFDLGRSQYLWTCIVIAFHSCAATLNRFISATVPRHGAALRFQNDMQVETQFYRIYCRLPRKRDHCGESLLDHPQLLHHGREEGPGESD